jgi:hypothetical protein
MTHQEPKIFNQSANEYENISLEVSDFPQSSNPKAEWWEQFGDCYDYWQPLPESEFDWLYWGLVRKKLFSVK